MSDQNRGKAIWGGLIGLALGALLAVHRVGELAAEKGMAIPGFLSDPGFYLHSPRFWFIVVVCTIVFAFIIGRVGRPTSPSDL